MKYKNLMLSAILGTIFLLPVFVYAQVYEPLVGIPGIDGDLSLDTYINTLYTLSISLAALLAVIKIIIAGVKWMLSDVVTSKSEAKKEIQGAIIGLLIVISAVLILETINPQLTRSSLLLSPVTQTVGGTVKESLACGEVNCDSAILSCKEKGGTPAIPSPQTTPPTVTCTPPGVESEAEAAAPKIKRVELACKPAECEQLCTSQGGTVISTRTLSRSYGGLTGRVVCQKPL
jgi:Type IV secretion system pilin